MTIYKVVFHEEILVKADSGEEGWEIINEALKAMNDGNMDPITYFSENAQILLTGAVQIHEMR